MQIFRTARLLVFSVLAAAAATWARAEEKTFSTMLTETEQQATGLTHLTADQRATLDNLVQREVRLAAQGNVTAFAGEFSKRRSAPEMAKAGIDKLTPDERSRLDAKVAAVIANRPQTLVAGPSRMGSVYVSTIQPKPEIHGEVSFTYGMASGGRSFYGGSVVVEQSDPSKGYTITVGYSEYRGKGMSFCRDFGAGYRWGYPYSGY
jgi:hypothetical protein